MCSAWKTAGPVTTEIVADEIRTIAQRNQRFLSRVGHVSFTGGEPILRHDLVELVRAAHEAFPKAAFNINTNGFDTRRTLAVVNEVLRFHRRLTVMVSLDGIGEAHNVVRGVPRVFPHVVETVDQLVGIREQWTRLTVEVNFVLTNRNSDQMLPVFHFCRERDIAFNPIYPVYGQLYENDEAEIGLERHVARRFLADLGEIQRTDRSLALQELAYQLEGRPRDYDCWAGRVLFFIESDCRVFPNGGCPPAFCLGGLRNFGYSFRTLLRSPQARGVLARLRKCRLCRLPCETMTTLNGPEALAGYRKTLTPAVEPTASAPASPRAALGPSRQRMC